MNLNDFLANLGTLIEMKILVRFEASYYESLDLLSVHEQPALFTEALRIIYIKLKKSRLTFLEGCEEVSNMILSKYFGNKMHKGY